MKYFSPSYWFKLWVLSAPLFKDKTQGINAKSIDNNQNIKDWASNNTDLQSINQELNFTNNTISNSTNIEIDNFYENFLKTQGWSKDPQIAQQQLIEIQEEHHHFLEAQHEKRSKRECINCNYFNISQDPYLKGRRMIMRIMGADKKQRFVIFFNKRRKEIYIDEWSCYDSFDLNSKESFWIILSIHDNNFNMIRLISWNSKTNALEIGLSNQNFLNSHNDNLICKYDDGYVIQVSRRIAHSIEFAKNDDDFLTWNTSNDSWYESFTILDDKIWEKNVFMEKFSPLVLEWNKNKEVWDREKRRQEIEDLPHYSEAQKRSWRGNKLNEINDKLLLLKNCLKNDWQDLEIKKIKEKINNLENKMNELNRKIDDITRFILELKNSPSSALSKCSSTSSIVGKIFGSFPIIGSAVDGLSWAISTACSLKSDYGRRKRDVFTTNIENKFNDSFIKSINQEQHLPISNNTNSNRSLSKIKNIIDIKEINSILFNNQTDTNYTVNNVTGL